MTVRVVVALQHHDQLDPDSLARLIVERAGFVVLSGTPTPSAFRLVVGKGSDMAQMSVEELQATLLTSFQRYHTRSVIVDVEILPPAPPPAQRWQVITEFLNVRSAPISADNILGTLPQGAIVIQTGPAQDFWIPHDGRGEAKLRGWSSSRYMQRL